jgi:hypothetical protein
MIYRARRDPLGRDQRPKQLAIQVAIALTIRLLPVHVASLTNNKSGYTNGCVHGYIYIMLQCMHVVGLGSEE